METPGRDRSLLWLDADGERRFGVLLVPRRLAYAADVDALDAPVGDGFIGIHGFEMSDSIEEDEAGSRHCSDGMNVANDDRQRSRWVELAIIVNLVGSDRPIGARRRWVFASSLWGRWSTEFREDTTNMGVNAKGEG
ncbi:hypothetical protein ACLOJK_027145 [Asimina triloba]